MPTIRAEWCRSGFRPEECWWIRTLGCLEPTRVCTAMLVAWREQMLAPGLSTQTAKRHVQPLERFKELIGEFS